jgi:hypothetical protein
MGPRLLLRARSIEFYAEQVRRLTDASAKQEPVGEVDQPQPPRCPPLEFRAARAATTTGRRRAGWFALQTLLDRVC